jgi:hypothetical protein
MKGIGKRVTVAFLSVVALLTVAGVISLFELSNLSYDTNEMISLSGRDMEATKGLLNAAHDHRRAMIDVAVFEDASRKSACKKALKEINAQVAAARSGASAAVRASLDTLAFYGAQLQKVAEGYSPIAKVAVAAPAVEVAASTDSTAVAPATQFVEQPVDVRRWFKETYDPAYDSFIKQVEYYTTLSHEGLNPRKEQLSKNAYRSVMPVLISLAVMIAIVLMLYYFIYIYAVKPILSINRSLADYLSFKLPYKTKASMIDEVKTLNDNIEHLINASKSNVKQE